MPETASGVELAWSAVAGLGLLIMAQVLARRIAREGRRKGNGGAKIASRFSIVKAIFGLLIELIACLIGIAAALTPEPVRPAVTAFQAFATAGLLGIIVLVLAWAIAEDWKDRALEHYYRGLEARVRELECIGIVGAGERHTTEANP